MRYIYPLAIIIVFSAIFTPLNANAQSIFIEQLLHDSTGVGSLDSFEGQSFTAETSGQITAVQFRPCLADLSGFDEIISLWQWNGTSTIPTELASTTFSGVDRSSIPCDSSTPFFTYILDSTFLVNQGDLFAIAFITNSPSAGINMRISFGNPYSGGERWKMSPDRTGFNVSPPQDFSFKLLSSLSFFDDFTSTSTVDILETTCDTTSNLFTNSLCKMMVFLFVPSPTVLNQFDNLRDDLAEKPPFGYLTAIISELENLEEATATIAIPDLSDLQDNFLTPIKIGISSLLFFMLAFWFFGRFRNFEL